MQTLTTAAEMLHTAKNGHSSLKRIGFVPTMGALHSGHISLVEKSKANNNLTVVSVFVNPTQFNNASDLEKYPRTIEKDTELLEQAGCDILFYPSVGEIYPGTTSLTIDFGTLETVMEGKFRPGHFAGVAQVVSRLFDLTLPTNAYFGEKDFQQLTIIRRMVQLLHYNVAVIGCPTLRETNGLAMSSRNIRLDVKERNQAALIYQTLLNASEMSKSSDSDSIKKFVSVQISNSGFMTLEYFEIADSETLQPLISLSETNKRVMCIAVWVRDVRLIDNLQF